MSAPPLIVIFGAAVRPDGGASEALLRRVGYGLDAAREHPEAPILCSGGVVRAGPSEASLMAELLGKDGIAPERLILDEASRNTLENCVAAAAAAVRGGHPHIVACSDAYHLPRIRMLLRLMGVPSRPAPFRRGPSGPPLAHRVGMGLRETLATPRSVAILLARRGGRRS